jgi:hypothetical protein
LVIEMKKKQIGKSLPIFLSLFSPVLARAQLVAPATVHKPTTGCSLAEYDVAKETTVRGSIATIHMAGTRGRVRTQVLIESARGVVSAELGNGPAANPVYLGISTGQPVEVTGMMERLGASAVLLARILTTPDRISILRNECGIPIRGTPRDPRGLNFGRPPVETKYLQTGAKELPMDREYDLFEKFPDGSLLWRGVVLGRENAIRKLQELAAKTPNECYAMHLATNEILASMNDRQSSLQLKALNLSQPSTGVRFAGS